MKPQENEAMAREVIRLATIMMNEMNLQAWNAEGQALASTMSAATKIVLSTMKVVK